MSLSEYGLNRSKAVNVCGVEDPAATEDAARSCSRADGGRRILSPCKSFVATREGRVARNGADQLNDTVSSDIFDVCLFLEQLASLWALVVAKNLWGTSRFCCLAQKAEFGAVLVGSCSEQNYN